jgi:hypothetical protein
MERISVGRHARGHEQIEAARITCVTTLEVDNAHGPANDHLHSVGDRKSRKIRDKIALFVFRCEN